MNARRYVIVPAAGGGSRFGGAAPKQYADLAGRSVLARTLDHLAPVDAAAIVVALAGDDPFYDSRVGPRAGVEVLRCGGPTRAITVRNAVLALMDRCGPNDWILVHDAARPCVPAAALRRLVAELADHPVGGLLAVPVADTLKRAVGSDDRRIARTESRELLWQAQTPQMFRARVLRDALVAATAANCTDEAQAVEALVAAGREVAPRLVPGSGANLKITYPEDLALAAAILAAEETSS